MTKPEELKEVSLVDLREVCRRYIEHIDGPDCNVDRIRKLEGQIAEIALESLYGDLWDWVNKKMDERYDQ